MHRLAFPILMMLIPRVLPHVLRYTRLVWRLIFDRRVNLVLRALVPLSLLYVISPFDLVKDSIPFLGRADDLIIVGLALLLLIKLSPRYIVDEHLGKQPKSNRPEDQDPSQVVDGSARFVDDN